MFHCTNKTCLDFRNAEVTSHPILNSKPNFKKSCHTYREAWKVKCHTQVYFLWPWQALQRSDHVCHWVQFWIYCFILFIPVHRINSFHWDSPACNLLFYYAKAARCWLCFVLHLIGYKFYFKMTHLVDFRSLTVRNEVFQQNVVYKSEGVVHAQPFLLKAANISCFRGQRYVSVSINEFIIWKLHCRAHIIPPQTTSLVVFRRHASHQTHKAGAPFAFLTHKHFDAVTFSILFKVAFEYFLLLLW